MSNFEIKAKLTPYQVWEKLGSPKKIVAPMVDHSDLAYRMMTRKYGADLVYTQMFNSNSFVNAGDYRENNFTTCPEDRPLIVQFAGHDPDTLLAAARLVEDRCDAVDINLGCPQGIAKRGRYGAYLMEELDLLDAMVRTMVNGLKVPVTCKTRIYKDFDRSIKLCETLVNAGASVLTIHGRTRDEKGQLVRDCDWDMIRRIKKHFSERAIPVPIIANGGIESLDDVLSCLSVTGVDGVMSSEGILENPALFARSLTRSGVYKNQIDLTGT
jgi:tRNA-dihydrouridine synthase 1